MSQITVDTGINTKPVLKGIRDMNSAIRSFQNEMRRAGKSMDTAANGYAKAMANQASAVQKANVYVQELKVGLAEIVKQMNDLANQDFQTEEFKKLNNEIEEQKRVIRELNDERARMVKDGSIYTNPREFQRLKDEIDIATNDLRAFYAERQRMIRSGESTIKGKETAEYESLYKKYTAMRESMNEAQKVVNKLSVPLHWNDMQTATQAISEGLARVAYAARTAGYALNHPLQTINRLIPIAVSGIMSLAQKAASVAISFGKWGIQRISAAIRGMASSAMHAASAFAKMAVNSAVSFLRRIAITAKDAAVSLARLVSTGVKSGFKKIASLAASAGKAILGLGRNARRSNNGLRDALKMIVRYGFGVRSLFILIRRLRSAITEAFKNMAKSVPEVNVSLSLLSSSLDMLKNRLATAFQPILTAVAPALTQFLDLMSQALTKVGEFLAALTGQQYVYEAVKAQKDYAKSLGKTKEEAKEAERQLASFDKLDILKDTKKDDDEEEETEFEKIPIEAGILDFVQRIKDALSKGNFEEIGIMLAQAINNIFRKLNDLINWDDIGDTITKYIKAFCDIINGLLGENGINWGLIGETIGNGIKTIIRALNELLEGIHWYDLGKGLATALNNMIATVPWDELGKLFANKLNAIFDIIRGFIDEFDEIAGGKALAEAVWGFFGNIKWKEIGETIGLAINEIASLIKAFAYDFPWVELGEKLATGANAMFDAIDFVGIADALIALFSGALNSLLTFIIEFDWKRHGEQLAAGIKQFVSNLPVDTIGEILRLGITGILKFIMPGLEDEETWAMAGSKLATLLNALFLGEGEDNIWDSIAAAIVNLAEGVVAALKNFVGNFEWGENGQKFHDAVFKLVENFPLNDLGNALSELIAGALEFMNETLGDDKLFNELGADIAGFFSRIAGDTQLWGEIGTIINNAFSSVLSLGEGFVNSFTDEKVARAAESIKNAFKKIDFNDIATRTWELIKEAFKKAGNFLNVLFADESEMHYDPWQKMYIPEPGTTLGTRFGNKIRDALKDIKWDEIATAIWSGAKAVFHGVEDFLLALFGIDELGDKTALEAIAEKVGSEFAKIPWGKALEETGAKLNEVIKGLVNGLFSGGESGNGLIGVEVIAGFVTLKTLLHGQMLGLQGALMLDLASIVGGASVYIANGVKEIIDNINDRDQAMSDTLATIMTTYVDQVKQGNVEAANEFVTSLTGIELTGNSFAENFGQIWTGVSQTWGVELAGMTDEVERAMAQYRVVFEKYGAETANQFAEDVYKIKLTGDDLKSNINALGDSVKETIKSGNLMKFHYDPEVSQYNKQTVDQYGNELTNEVKASWDNLEKAVNAEERGKTNIVDYFKGWQNALKEHEESTKSITQSVFEAILKAVKVDTLKEHSPSELSKEWGKNLMLGFDNGISENQETSQSVLKGAFDKIVGVFTKSWEGVDRAQTEKLGEMNTNLSTKLDEMKGTSEQGNENTAKPFYDKYGEIMVAVEECMRAAYDYLVKYVGDMRTESEQGATDMNQAFDSGMHDMERTVSWVMPDIQRTLEDGMRWAADGIRWIDWWGVGADVVYGIENGIMSNWGWLESTVWGLAMSLYNTACSALGIHSPSTLFRDGVGKMLGLGVAEGMEDSQPDILETVVDVADAMREKMASEDMQIGIGTEDAFETFGDRITDGFTALMDRLQAIADSVTFRMPAVATGTVLPYNVAAQTGGASNGLASALTASNDDLANVIIQASNNAALAIVNAIQKYSGQSGSGVTTQQIIDDINRRAKAQGTSPIIV